MPDTDAQTTIPARTIENATEALRHAAFDLDDATVDAAIVGVLDAIAPATTFHQHRIHRMQAEAAVEIVAAQRSETSRIRQILKLDGPSSTARGFIANSIDLGAGTWIVEIEKGPFGGKAPFVVIHDLKDTHTFHATLDEALLYAIELRAGGAPDGGGYRFAARMLGVKTAFDA